MDPNAPQHIPLPDGSDVGGYDITRTLGSGTFGIVYRAEGHVLKDPVAIKEFFPRDIAYRAADGQVVPKQDHGEEFAWALDRFVSEAKTLRRLAEPQPHPNIIQVQHVIEKNGTSYFVMKWEDGEALEAVLKREPPWDEERLRRLLEALLAGLEHVHDAEVLHRDIKPSNILIRPDGTPVLIDFGSSRLVSGNQDLSKYVQLTPGFAPPEQQYGQYGKWTDIYSLAATLFYALTGRKPDPVAAERPRLADELQGRYTDGFLRGIDEALELNHRERPQSVVEWRSALGPGAQRRAAVAPDTRQETPSDDSEATIIVPKSGLTRQQPAGQAGSPTVVLDGPPEPATADGSLAVAPYHTDPTGRDEPRSKGIGWLRTHWLSALSLAVAAGILALLIWLWAGLTGSGSIPPRPDDSRGNGGEATSEQTEKSDPGPEPSPPPSLEQQIFAVEQQISAVLAGFDCTPLQEEKLAEGSYAIRGHVAGRADFDRLDAELGAIPQTTIDISGVAIVPRPLCPLLELVSQYATEPRLTIIPNHADGRYTTGDDFGVTFHNTDRSSGRLHAFYIDSKGEIYAPPEAFDRLLYIGAEAGLTGYYANAPGKDLVLALWCRGGVNLPQSLAQLEHMQDFRPALARILKEHASDCGATWRFIEIR